MHAREVLEPTAWITGSIGFLCLESSIHYLDGSLRTIAILAGLAGLGRGIYLADHYSIESVIANRENSDPTETSSTEEDNLL